MKKGFTLTELLMALTIVGVLAVLTIPILMNNIHNRVFANQVKNMAATIEQLAQDELIAHRTRDLSDTDFADPEKLLSDKHFSITKTCTATNAAKDCWKTAATGKDKVTYKSLNKANYSFSSHYTIILKNGVIIKYNTVSNDGKTVGFIFMDVNGNDKPNLLGRDVFGFYVTSKGHVADSSILLGTDIPKETKVNNCKNNTIGGTGGFGLSSEQCYGALVDNGWKMDY